MRCTGDYITILTTSRLSKFFNKSVLKTRRSKHCGFCIKINGQVGQGREDGLVWSGLCLKDSQDDFDSEYIGFDD